MAPEKQAPLVEDVRVNLLASSWAAEANRKEICLFSDLEADRAEGVDELGGD